MARRRARTAGKLIPAWLLDDWGDRTAEAAAYCEANDINPITLIRFQCHRIMPSKIRFSRAERREIATWQIAEPDSSPAQ